MTSPPAAHVARTPDRQDKLTGIACGIGAGALWGLVFLAPELASAFNPLQLTVGRGVAQQQSARFGTVWCRCNSCLLDEVSGNGV